MLPRLHGVSEACMVVTRAGEPCFLPQQFRTARPIANPTEYTRLWVTEVAGAFQGGVCEVPRPSTALMTLI